MKSPVRQTVLPLLLFGSVLVLALVSCAVVTVTTRLYGGAIWPVFKASWRASEADLENRPRPAGCTEEDLDRLLEIARYWQSWRDLSWYGASGAFLFSLGLLAWKRSWQAAVLFLFVALLTLHAWMAMSILF